MESNLNIRQKIGYQLVRAGQVILGAKDTKDIIGIGPIGRDQSIEHCLKFRNPFSAILVRKMGVKLEPRVIQVVYGWNDVTTVGKNHMLDVTFGNSSPVTQVATWYEGLINNTPTPVLVAGDTLASHSGWSELTSYSGTRKAWDDLNSSAAIKGTNTISTFTANATITVYGIFVCSVTSGTGGILWATGAFDATVSMINGDDLKVSYGIRS